MATVRTIYYPGGATAAPGGGISELWDLAAATYTHFDVNGVVLETRPLTAAESTQMQTVATGQQVTDSIAKLSALTAQAITDNDAYLAIANPGAADQVAQIRRLTRQALATARYLSTVVPQPAPTNNLSDVTDVTTP